MVFPVPLFFRKIHVVSSLAAMLRRDMISLQHYNFLSFRLAGMAGAGVGRRTAVESWRVSAKPGPCRNTTEEIG